MTSEEQLRAALLGGRQLTTMLASSRQSTALLDQQELKWISSLYAQEGMLRVFESAPDIWRLASIFQKAIPEAERIRAIGRTYEVESVALLRPSEDAQWQSLRNNVFHRLESLFTFRERAKVMSFLERNFFLTPLLLQAHDKITEFFGSSRVALEVSTDHDDGNSQELWVRIETNSAPEDALSILTRFDEEWWLDASASSQNLLNIKLEYL